MAGSARTETGIMLSLACCRRSGSPSQPGAESAPSVPCAETTLPLSQLRGSGSALGPSCPLQVSEKRRAPSPEKSSFAELRRGGGSTLRRFCLPAWGTGAAESTAAPGSSSLGPWLSRRLRVSPCACDSRDPTHTMSPVTSTASCTRALGKPTVSRVSRP